MDWPREISRRVYRTEGIAPTVCTLANEAVIKIEVSKNDGSH